jgi:hypothetical protein
VGGRLEQPTGQGQGERRIGAGEIIRLEDPRVIVGRGIGVIAHVGMCRRPVRVRGRRVDDPVLSLVAEDARGRDEYRNRMPLSGGCSVA